MKAVVLLVFLVALVFISETESWRLRRTIRKVGRAIGRGVRIVRRAIRIYRRVRKYIPLGKRDAGMNEDEFLTNLATRDISDIVDVSQMTDADLEELLTAQRQTREVMQELKAAEAQEQQ